MTLNVIFPIAYDWVGRFIYDNFIMEVLHGGQLHDKRDDILPFIIHINQSTIDDSLGRLVANNCLHIHFNLLFPNRITMNINVV